jgi:NADPH-dependent 2,4-dienoyl-CoA reductase/sulfur reductase-like enzyme
MSTSLVSATMEVEVLVVGGGPAGIAAAVRSAETSKSVVLIDESPALGGQIWRHRSRTTLPAVALGWLGRLDASGARILRGTSVVDVREDGDTLMVTAEHNGVPVLVRARAIVLATGARERFLPFPGWTLPGVIGVGAAQALLASGFSFSGKRIVIAGSGPLLLPVASALKSSGALVQLVAEQASRRAVVGFAMGLLTRPRTLLQAARYRAGFRGAPYHCGEWVSAARGDNGLSEVDITNGVSTRTIACDVLCAAFGLVPNTELARLLGCSIANAAVVVDDRQQTTRARIYCAGEPTGIGGMELAIAEGELAGLCAAGGDADARLVSRRNALRASAERMERAFAPRAELRALATPDTIVCRCEDVTLGAIDRSWSMRKAKLYTRAGMGPCQGRICGNALEFLYGWPPDTVRLPAVPALVSTLTAESATTLPSAHQGA